MSNKTSKPGLGGPSISRPPGILKPTAGACQAQVNSMFSTKAQASKSAADLKDADDDSGDESGKKMKGYLSDH